ncbi:MAG: 1-(5-phosphoribosyl)-5-[(5-phosphoribosylamino)methylideneamino]imidazole-4-carboxamide isomerase [Oscillospiraceae bacterium]|jgi:phosphoribosylformimino-5-aminoimidazole carboxamide ribotide isomerase|nr:1-(5-phosphoribosyl)-5-[(5-phosphoribosylamino)methylideneamino]imidazole-4-carboxamide isomerase [Oscillospiraceae bacterium]
MLLLPAIDLYDGRAVRLTRGDYAQMTVYDDDPTARARVFSASGAHWLHVVDLEGARDGTTPNFDCIARLIATSGMSVEIGGGIRDADTARRYIDAGAARVILGTAAVASPELVARLTAELGEKIAVGVDLRDGRVAVKGWTETTDLAALDFCLELEALGVKTVICTDISKDGLLSGANIKLYGSLSQRLTLSLIASGGVSSLADIAALRDIGLYGAILGKALYEGRIDLAEALKTARA